MTAKGISSWATTPGVPDVVLSSQFDAQGNRTSLSAAIGGVKDFLSNYSYDALSRLTLIEQQQQTGGDAVAPKSIYLGYDAIGDATVVNRANWVGMGPNAQYDPADTSLTYNMHGLLTGMVSQHDGNTLENLSRSYDSLARVSTFGSIDGTATYGYDPTSQLISATYTGTNQPPDETESYDLNGNRTAADGPGKYKVAVKWGAALQSSCTSSPVRLMGLWLTTPNGKGGWSGTRLTGDPSPGATLNNGVKYGGTTTVTVTVGASGDAPVIELEPGAIRGRDEDPPAGSRV